MLTGADKTDPPTLRAAAPCSAGTWGSLRKKREIRQRTCTEFGLVSDQQYGFV